MRKFLLLFTVLIGVSLMSVNAQNYEVNKLKYDYRMYVPEFGDPYNPTIAGVCSFLLPGFGQVISGEIGRGLSFFVGYVSSAIVSGIGDLMRDAGLDAENESITSIGNGIILVGVAGALGVAIASTVDAVKVAKVNNLYVSDYRKSKALLEFAPYIGQFNAGNQIVRPVGMSMCISF